MDGLVEKKFLSLCLAWEIVQKMINLNDLSDSRIRSRIPPCSKLNRFILKGSDLRFLLLNRELGPRKVKVQ